MHSDLSILELTQRFAAELSQRSRHQLDRLEADNARLQDELNGERSHTSQLQAQLSALQERLIRQEHELAEERQARLGAEREVAVIHAAIAQQLEMAEREHAAQEALEAERERQHQQHIETLRLQLIQERLRREALQQRVESLRTAAADLFAIDLSGSPSAAEGVLAASHSRLVAP